MHVDLHVLHNVLDFVLLVQILLETSLLQPVLLACEVMRIVIQHQYYNQSQENDVGV